MCFLVSLISITATLVLFSLQVMKIHSLSCLHYVNMIGKMCIINELL